MKLQILITQYSETEKIIKPLLESINLQQNIDLEKDIEVIIMNDGSNIKLSETFLEQFSFPIHYIYADHIGLSGCRQRLLDISIADYVMFCDADDMFLSSMALFIIFQAIKKNPDIIDCAYVIEEKIKNNEIILKKCFKNHARIQAKVFRKQFLIEKNIYWPEEMRRHCETFFNALAFSHTKNIIYYSDPIYLWKWNNNSLSRSDSKYPIKTYLHLIGSNIKLVEEFLKRKMLREAKFYLGTMIYQTYYSLNHEDWYKKENLKYLYVTEKCFQYLYKNYKTLFNDIDPIMKKQIIKNVKNGIMKEGVLLEKITFDNWIKHIENLK